MNDIKNRACRIKWRYSHSTHWFNII